MNCKQHISTIIRQTSLLAIVVMFVHQNSLAQLVPNLGSQRSGISSFQFLKIGADARGAAMGEAIVAVSNDVSSLYWNPAGLTNSTSNQAVFSHSEWLIDLQHEFFAISYALGGNDFVGLSFTSLHTDPMPITTEYQPTGNGNFFNFSDIAIGGTYARKMTDQFSFGITARYVRENIAELHTNAVLIDIGTYYFMGLGSSRFSVVVSNFGDNVKPSGTILNGAGENVNSFQGFSPPTIFKLGYAFEPWMDETNRVTTSIQLNHPNDNAENIRLGAEYEYDTKLFLRAGVKRTIGESLFGKSVSSAEDFSFGAGVRIPLGITVANVDYAFSNFNELGSVNRISVILTY